MGTVYSIRGTNGSGKSTVARWFLGPPLSEPLRGGPVQLNYYSAPTVRDPERKKRADGFIAEHERLGLVGVVGSYNTACGGMDRMPSFEVCRGAISFLLDALGCNQVIAEGLLASGVYGSWGEYAKLLKTQGHVFAFCYLDTPYEVCVERIKARQRAAGKEGKEINWSLVRAKYDNTIGNRKLALAAGEMVYDLPHDDPVRALRLIMTSREGDRYRAE